MKKLKDTLTILYNNKRAFVGSIILLIFIFFATLGPLVFPLDLTPNADNRYRMPIFIEAFIGPAGPIADQDSVVSGSMFGTPDDAVDEEHDKKIEELKANRYLLGTDFVGRDIFRGVVAGSRDVLIVGFMAAIMTLLIGFIIGSISGYAGGRVDSAIMLVTNLFVTIPAFPIMLILSAFIKVASPFTLAVILSFWSWGGLARSIRAQILSLKNREFVTVCRVMNLNNMHVIFSEILPNLFSYLSITFIQTMQGAIVASVGIMMLGFAPYAVTNWGVMLNNAIAQGLTNKDAYNFMFWPMFTLALFQFGCIFFASGLDDIFNPRIRTSIGGRKKAKKKVA